MDFNSLLTYFIAETPHSFCVDNYPYNTSHRTLNPHLSTLRSTIIPEFFKLHTILLRLKSGVSLEKSLPTSTSYSLLKFFIARILIQYCSRVVGYPIVKQAVPCS